MLYGLETNLTLASDRIELYFRALQMDSLKQIEDENRELSAQLLASQNTRRDLSIEIVNLCHTLRNGLTTAESYMRLINQCGDDLHAEDAAEALKENFSVP